MDQMSEKPLGGTGCPRGSYAATKVFQWIPPRWERVGWRDPIGVRLLYVVIEYSFPVSYHLSCPINYFP